MANTTPRFLPNGIQDGSAAPIPARGEADIHDSAPYVMAYAERGPFYPVYINGLNKNRVFGTATFDENSIYATPVTKLLNLTLANGSDVLFHRCPIDGASPASVRLAVELVPAKLQRRVNGTNSVVLGYELIWHILPANILLSQHYNPEGADQPLPYNTQLKAYEYRSINSSVGGVPLSNIHAGISNPPEYKTLLFPVLTSITRDLGVSANDLELMIGVQQISKVGRLSILAQSAIALEVGFKYKGNILLSGLGEKLITVNTNPKGTDQFGRAVYQPSIVNDRYAQFEGADNISPVGEFCLHDESIRSLQTILLEGHCSAYTTSGNWLGEAHYQLQDDAVEETFMIDDTTEYRYTLDIFTGQMLSGGQLYTVSLNSNMIFGELSFAATTNIRYTGAKGDLPRHPGGTVDVDMTWAKLDLAYREVFENLDTDPYGLTNMVSRPFGHLYDVGFSMDTKRALLNITQHRKDVIVYVTPFSYGEIEITEDQPDDGDGDGPFQISCAGATDYIVLSSNLD